MVKYNYLINRKEEKMKINTKIFDMLINEQPLIRKELINNGVPSNEIANLIMKKKLVLGTDNNYLLIDTKEFLNYGIKLLRVNITKAKKCFELCYRINPTNKEVALQYFLLKLANNDYDLAYEVFVRLDRNTTIHNIKANNLYLYLLSKLTECGYEYERIVNELKLEDLLIDTKDKGLDNELIKTIFNGNYNEALTLVTSIINNKSNYMIKYELIRLLLIKVIEKQNILNSDYINNNILEEANELINMILNEYGMTLEEGIKNFGILPKWATLMRLIMAGDCYNWGDIECGDIYLKRVELNYPSDKEVYTLLDEVKSKRLILKKDK